MNTAQMPNGKSVLLAGATGYIGRYVARELMSRGYRVISFGRRAAQEQSEFFEQIIVDLCDAKAVADLKNSLPECSGIVSCLGSKTGGRRDAWAVEYDANQSLLSLAQDISTAPFILLSAICVQKPRLEFQFAKRAFEDSLIASGVPYSIVRPTAYFKSLAGQIDNVKRGKAFMMFDTGNRTACKPISGEDLAKFLCDCLDHPDRFNRVLPIGGPGPAITSEEQAEILFRLLGKPMKTRKIPSVFFQIVDGLLAPFSVFSERLADTREFLRIGHYYATESMLLWDEKNKTYNPQKTPEFGSDRLETFYQMVLETGLQDHDLGAHKLF